jgi:hypothetical protein
VSDPLINYCVFFGRGGYSSSVPSPNVQQSSRSTEQDNNDFRITVLFALAAAIITVVPV